MKTELTITDITNMHAKKRICIAGIDDQYESIRPKYQGKNILLNWCWQGNQVIRPFSRIKLDLLRNTPNPPHTEDWIVRDNYLEVTGKVENHEKENLLRAILDPDVPRIFGTPIEHITGEGTFVHAGRGNRSLGTVKVHDVMDFSNAEYEHGFDYRITFRDQTNNLFKLRIVDLSFQSYIDSLRENNKKEEEIESTVNLLFSRSTTYFRIGLSRHWGKFPDRCYLQITGVYTFPDYLCGKCFADFITPDQ